MIKKVKIKAKYALEGNWFAAIVAFLLYVVLFALMDATVIGILFSGVLTFGYAAFSLHLIQTKRAKVGSFFSGMLRKLFKKCAASFLMSLYTFLWSLLLIIPGIVKYYAYAMTPYIMTEKPDMGINEAIAKSQQIMKGHKWKLFLLDLSFTGWMLLSILTAGIALFYAWPYYNAAKAAFYKEIKKSSKKTQKN